MSKCKCESTPEGATRQSSSAAQFISRDECVAMMLEADVPSDPEERRKFVVAVDFDGTLCREAYPEIGEARTEIIVALIRLRAEGVRLILWTCRCDNIRCASDIRGEDCEVASLTEGVPDDKFPWTRNLLREAVAWCRERGLEFDAVNENLADRAALYGGDPRKISADLYLDDKGLTA